MPDGLHTQFDQDFFERTRLSILTLLYTDGETSFADLRSTLELSDGALYSHIRKLSAKNLIHGEKRIVSGQAATIYSLTGLGIQAYEAYLGFLEQLLAETKEKRS
ncbi:transcriptional regulator [Spirochaeta lutea]|uniref:Winged helix DNA-binding domain-containing protein n=1 Tax=Spirochaeta lutea TaxID=1480694 RepID=A0A098QTM8_9SPIO|nr:transcriptional regulator [Spirochaeta lutea]KGE70911.1 hypothetical protein DC28_13265 [Spirochaeta lutea]